MAEYFWDPEGGSDANGGGNPLSPVRSWNAANIGGGVFAPGDTLRMKAGATYNAAAGGRLAPAFSASPTQSQPFRLTTYGDPGKRGIVDGRGTRDIGIRPALSIDQTNGPRWVTVENMEVKNLLSHGISIAEVLDTGVTDANNTIRNCYVHHCIGVSNPAINIYGQNIRVENCIVEDVGADGILFRGRGYVGYNTIRRVSNTGGGLGDGIQIDGKHGSSIVEFNDITRENRDKQALLVVGDGSIIRFNKIRGQSIGAGLLTVFESQGNVIYGNYLEGVDGLYLLDATGPHIASGNVLVGIDPEETEQNSTGIDCGATYTHAHRIYNNFVRGHRRGIFARSTICRNNIVVECGGTGIDVGIGATAESNNICSQNGLDFSATPGVGSRSIPNIWDYINKDGSLKTPFDVGGIPMRNPLGNAGVYIDGVRLMSGQKLSAFRPVVGAYPEGRY